MKRLIHIFILFFLINSSMIFAGECRERERHNNSLKCIEIANYIHVFNLAMRDQKEPTDDYPEYKKEMECLIRELINSYCESDIQDSIRIDLQYYYAINSSSIQGDLEYYGNILSNSKLLLENEVKEILKQKGIIDDPEEIIRLDARILHYEARSKEINDKLQSLEDDYANIELFLDSPDARDDKYTEMVQVVHKDSGKPVTIKINAPPDMYINPEYFQRIKYLQEFRIKFELTSYDSVRGFYCKIPLVPINLGKSVSTIEPQDTYTVSFSGGKRDRFEFFRDDRDRTLSEVPIIKPSPDWMVNETIPEDWAKMQIPKNLTWWYNLKGNDKTIARIARYNHKNDKYDRFTQDDNILIIDRGEYFALYQKLHQGRKKMDYDLIISSEEEHTWMRVLLPVIAGLTSLLLYAGTF
ncbi:MAG TPA: hypothetical protein EYO26_02085 [Dehalococcoidia bacterium]|nr:hypothetical protein [Dehalococcoidia bacterium]